jgi:O-antigen ligase
MFALPPLLCLLVIDYFKPQEFIPLLAGLPLLYGLSALTLAGFIIDLRLGVSELRMAPQVPLVLLFLAWAFLTVLVKRPSELTGQVVATLIPVSLFFLVGQVVQSFRALQIVVGLLLGIATFLAVISVHQGLAPFSCVRVVYPGGIPTPVDEGRECVPAERNECEDELAEPGADYLCEHLGLLGTYSDHGRVRFRGTLQDPNELSLAVCVALPFAFAFLDRRRTALRAALLVGVTILFAVCTVMSGSRGGQLVFLAVLGVYFLRRFGWRGLALAVVLALPLLALGGRSDADAESSTMERLECWREGIRMFFANPIFGVGKGQFTEHHFLTAHNSFVLAVAELGAPGLFLFSLILYLTGKIAFEIVRTEGMAQVARTWALAMLAMVAGLVTGITFLSYVYKEILWILLGLGEALYHAVRRHRPDFAVRLSARELRWVLAADAVLITYLWVYTRLKVGS